MILQSFSCRIQSSWVKLIAIVTRPAARSTWLWIPPAIPNLDADKAGWADCYGFYGKKSAKISSVSVIRVLILVTFGIAEIIDLQGNLPGSEEKLYESVNFDEINSVVTFRVRGSDTIK